MKSMKFDKDIIVLLLMAVLGIALVTYGITRLHLAEQADKAHITGCQQ